MVSSGFLPTRSNLLQSLLHICNEVASTEKLPYVQVKNVSTMRRRIKLLASLFEELQEVSTPLPPSSVLCLNELLSVIQRLLLLIQGCKEGSSLWNLLQTDIISNQYHVVVKEMGSALDILPLSLLDITTDTKEQVELLRKQAKRAELFVEQKDVQRREELLLVMGTNKYRNNKHKTVTDSDKLKEILSSMGVRSPLDFEEEISKLEAEAKKQAGTGGLIVVSNINNLMSLVSLSKSTILKKEETERRQLHDQKQSTLSWQHDSSSSSTTFNVPDDYRCPISLELMRDPVIVATGQTYDRSSISQWLHSGHHTCPKSGQKLDHMALIPNYALKCLIQQWCQENNIPIAKSTSSTQLKQKLSTDDADPIFTRESASDAVKMTAEFLVGKLATGSPVIQRQAAYELRLLAKTGMDNRRIIAEAGAIPFLVTLLVSNDSIIQGNAVTALLNLSIFDNNKRLIMSAGSLDSIVHVLQLGKTMEARENAAATIFSLSMIDDLKVIIGNHPKAILALVNLLKEGTTTGKRDAATALYKLSDYSANKASVVCSGAVPLLIDILMDDKAGITDDALALLALLLGCPQGMAEVTKSRVLVPLLIDLMRLGSPKGKEYSITLLFGQCKDGAEDVLRRLLMNPRSIACLQSLAAEASSPKSRKKAEILLRYLNRFCFQSRNSQP